MSKDKEENKNIYNDRSVRTAKNHCYNPNMNVNGTWCFVQNEDVITMEQCDVCQSFDKSIIEYWSKLSIDFFKI